jgi:hypothetical protein
MTDIEPWLQTDAPPDVAESLRAARAEAPRRALVERCVALVGTASAVGLSTSLANAASYGAGGKATGLFALLKWGLSGAAVGTVLVTSVEVTRRVAAPRPVPSVHAPSVIETSVTSAKRALNVRAPLPLAPVAPTATPEPARAPKVSSAPGIDERLAAELSLLNDVRAAVDRRDTDAALSLLAEHDRRYATNAQLLPEARYLRLETLELAGRGAEARSVARQILERDPRGPHAARAREVLEKE